MTAHCMILQVSYPDHEFCAFNDQQTCVTISKHREAIIERDSIAIVIY